MFGYACHNTTLTGEFYQISGDYAGFAQIGVEKAHPGANGMFVMLCGADQIRCRAASWSWPSSTGASLAGEVNRVLGGELQRVRGPFVPLTASSSCNQAAHKGSVRGNADGHERV